MVGVRIPVGPGKDRIAAAMSGEVRGAGDNAIGPASLRKGANMRARIEVADAVAEALRADGRSLREIAGAAGLQAADLSRLARGKKGTTVASLALLARALGKRLKISIE